MAPVKVPWGDDFSIGRGVARLCGTSRGCAFDGESLQAAKVQPNSEDISVRAAEFDLSMVSNVEGYSKAVRLSGSAGVRVKAVASSTARLSLLNEAASNRTSVSLYGRKWRTSEPVMQLQPEALPQFSTAAKDCFANKGVLGFIEAYGTHFVAGYTDAASYDALVTFLTFGSATNNVFAAGAEADVPIPQAGGAVNVSADLGFSRCSNSVQQEKVLCIKVKTLGVDNTCGFHPVTLADLDREMSMFGKQQGCGAKYHAIVLPYSVHPFFQSIEQNLSEYAGLLSPHVEAIIVMLNKVDYLVNMYLTAAEAQQDMQPSDANNCLCTRLRVFQGHLGGLEDVKVFCPLLQQYIKDHETGDLQHNPLYKLVHEDIRGFAHYLRETGWIKDGKLLLGQKAAMPRTYKAMLRSHCWWDYLAVSKHQPKLQPKGSVWEVQEVIGLPAVDGNYCVTIRDRDSGLYLSYQGDKSVSLQLTVSAKGTETWRMEDLGRCASDANAMNVAFRGISGGHYYLSGGTAGWTVLRTNNLAWEHWSLHLQ